MHPPPEMYDVQGETQIRVRVRVMIVHVSFAVPPVIAVLQSSYEYTIVTRITGQTDVSANFYGDGRKNIIATAKIDPILKFSKNATRTSTSSRYISVGGCEMHSGLASGPFHYTSKDGLIL
eukprot:scaffold512645_cov46-Prasinocladus_malaysianus.AAC.1